MINCLSTLVKYEVRHIRVHQTILFNTTCKEMCINKTDFLKMKRFSESHNRIRNRGSQNVNLKREVLGVIFLVASLNFKFKIHSEFSLSLNSIAKML